MSVDMGVLPRLLDHHLPPGICDVLPAHARQEPQLHAPHRGRAQPV